MNKRLTFKLIGYVLAVEALLMILPLGVDLVTRSHDALAFVWSMLITAACGGAMTLLRPRNDNLRAREGFAIVAISWLLVSFFGALPFVFSGAIPSMVDAFFETASGFTTTGATILTDVEALSKSMLFWRSFSHWVGGMGVLVLSLALLPKMGDRSIYLMRAESPGPSTDKLVPRLSNNAKILYLLYLALSVLMVIALLFCGLDLFDALIHTFGAAGTGGFSSYNASVGHFTNPAVHVVIGVFMALFGVNFSMYYYLIRRNWSGFFGNSELRVYLGIMLGSTLVIAWNILPLYGNDIAHSLRDSFFQVSSVMTTTGYGTTDFDLWPQLSRTLLVGLMIIGASAGSTGGGIKVIRLQLLVKGMQREIRKTIHPKSVNTIRMDGHTVSDSTVTGVFAFFFTYLLVLCVSTIAVSLDGFTFETNLTAVIATLSNIGPGLGAVGPTGNYAAFSDASKIVLSLCMLIGRLEIFPMLILLAPSAWKRY